MGKSQGVWLVSGLVVVLSLCLLVPGQALSGVSASPATDTTMGHGDASEILVARVNGTGINMAALMERMLDIVEKRYGRREITPILAGKIKNESIDQLITAELAYQVASRVVAVDEETLNKVVADRIKSLGGDESFEEYMQAKQIKNRAEFAEKMRRFLVVQKYITENIESKIEVTDEMIAAAYHGAAGTYFNKPEVVQVTKITFFLDPAVQESYEQIQKIRGEIIDDFGGDPTRLPVDGTFIAQENIKLSKTANKKLYEIARKLEKFGISDVVESNGTLHLLQLTGYQPAVSKTLEEVSGYLRQEVFGRQKRALVNEWMANIRQGADIEIIAVME